MKRLALFDFDGTLTNRDTLLEFLKFYVGPVRFYIGMTVCSPFLVAYKLGILRNWKAKERVLTYFLRGEEYNEFLSKGRTYALQHIPLIIKQKAMDRLLWHQEAGDRIIVVSASIAAWIEPWTEKHGVELISTFLQLKDGRLTGKLQGKNCYGPEKVRRLEEIITVSDYDEIFVYGDSRGDREMLAYGTTPFYRKFS